MKSSKNLVLSLGALVSLSFLQGVAFAKEIRTPIKVLSQVSLVDSSLEFAYPIVSGCVKHKTEVSVSLEKISDIGPVKYKANVIVIDVSPEFESEFDLCKAEVWMDGWVSTAKLIKQEAEKLKLDPKDYTKVIVNLPAVTVNQF